MVEMIGYLKGLLADRGISLEKPSKISQSDSDDWNSESDDLDTNEWNLIFAGSNSYYLEDP